MATISVSQFSTNVGRFDRAIRIAVGLIVVVLGVLFQSWWGLLGLVLVVTGLTSFCPIYRLFRLNTRA